MKPLTSSGKDRAPIRRSLICAGAVAATLVGTALAQTAAPVAPAAPPPRGESPPPQASAAPVAAATTPSTPVVLPPEEVLPPEATPAAPDSKPAPVVAAPEPPAEPEPPAMRARYDVAILQALDKITAETVRFEAAVGRPVRYKSLVFTVRACERATDDEATPDAIAYVTIESQPKAAPGKPTPPPRRAFRGWMFASSPGLHPLEHPVYDAWLITCRAAAPPNG